MAKAPAKAEDHVEELSPVAKVARQAPRQLPAYEIQPEGIKWGRWAVLSHPEHTIQDVLEPGYLFTKGEQFKGGDYIEIKHPFGLFCVCLDVVRVDMQARGLVAHIRHIFDYTQAAERIAPTLDGVKIENLGANQWSIIDGRNIVADNFATRAAAEKWLADRKAA